MQTDPLTIMEALARRHPNMRLSRALAEIKQEMRKQAVLDELRSQAPALVPVAPSAVTRIAANMRAIADRLEGRGA